MTTTEIITIEHAKEIAEKNLYEYLTAEWGQRLVSDFENPLEAYIQQSGSYSMAGEVFSVKCGGLNNIDLQPIHGDYYERDDEANYIDPDSKKVMSEKEMIADVIENGDMTEWVDDLAERIYESAKETADSIEYDKKEKEWQQEALRKKREAYQNCKQDPCTCGCHA